MVHVDLLPAFADNYIFCFRAGTSGVFVVDPGDASPVRHYLQRSGLEPAAIFVTHHHADHVGGVRELSDHYAIPVYGPRQRTPGLTHALSPGRQLIEGIPMEVIAVPGHTLDHVAYLVEDALFCGDTLFSAGCGRLFEGTPAQMHDSLARLSSLPDNTRIYCAHEYTLSNLRFARQVEPDNPALRARMQEVEILRKAGRPSIPSRMDIEQASNPFLRTQMKAVQDAAQAFDPLCNTTDPVSVFAALRRWKDQF